MIRARGLDEATEFLERMGERAEDVSPAMEAFARRLEAFIHERFSTRTAPDGAPWPPLKAKSTSTGGLEGSIAATGSNTGVAVVGAEHALPQNALRRFLPEEDDDGPGGELVQEIQEALEQHIAPE